jgi:NADH:ubiquinone oxidoreductase subunit C
VYKNKKFPVQLFFFFENLEIFYWTSTVLKANHSICYLPNNTAKSLAAILKFESSLNRSQLVEMSAIDMSTNKKFKEEDFLFFFNKNKKLIFYIFYIFSIQQRITFFLPVVNSVCSIESYFSNANWLERETAEMYGVNFLFKKDSRNLLLDYTILENPLLKSYPCIGTTEVVYNPLQDNVTYCETQHVEL